MNAGDTFRLKDVSIERRHPWVILSETTAGPDVVIGNFTEWDANKELHCVCDESEPCLTKRSIFSYRDVKIVNLSQLAAFAESGAIVLGPAISPTGLERIRAGAALSRFIPTGPFGMLEDQGLIPLI